jgi:GrpB-like predicted nucleotidyltransferase (UPF0157 family)
VTDVDNRATLVAICEALKVQYVSLGSLERSFYALFQALLRHHPDLEQQYLEVANRAVSAENPATASRIQQLDALLEQLKKQ